MSDKDNGGSAFPLNASDAWGGPVAGMTLRDWFAGQAIANFAICTGKAEEYELTAWFGPHRTGITRAEIVAKQAYAYADAMLEVRK